MRGPERPILEWGAAGVALSEQGAAPESGDVDVVAHFPDGALVALIDGLGHGAEAAFAARTAAQLLRQHASEPVLDLVQRCHNALRTTRGVVMTLASFDTRKSSMTWIGVGNVEGVLLRASSGKDRPREAVVSRGGIVGYQLPPLRAAVLPISPGDTLIMATDGVRDGFMHGVIREHTPQAIADSSLARYRKESDDALVVVARYVMDSP
jgi:negative regulator of sigma-B (phosphoserine phosphatase)